MEGALRWGERFVCVCVSGDPLKSYLRGAGSPCPIALVRGQSAGVTTAPASTGGTGATGTLVKLVSRTLLVRLVHKVVMLQIVGAVIRLQMDTDVPKRVAASVVGERGGRGGVDGADGEGGGEVSGGGRCVAHVHAALEPKVRPPTTAAAAAE